MKRVIFLGAGASKPFGFPLTNELLYKIKLELDNKTLFEDFEDSSSDRNKLYKWLNILIPGWHNTKPEHLPLITDILSLVDYSLVASISPIIGQEVTDLREFRTLLEKAILEVLWWPYSDDNIPPLLLKMRDWIDRFSSARGNVVGIISSNYDISLDAELFELHGNNIHKCFDFGFDWRHPYENKIFTRPSNPNICLYKLHGSLNWLRCDLCEHIYINVDGDIAFRGFEKKVSDANTCHCNHHRLRPVLVAPSIVRDVRDVNLLEIWKHSLELLRTADEWIIIGYSMPPEDIAIRSLFIRALQGRKKSPRIDVVQRGDDPITHSRYNVFFPGNNYYTDGLEGYLKDK